MPSSFVKDPDADLNYEHDLSDWLATGETISTATWTVPDGLTEGTSSHTDTTATVRLSGGTAGQTYQVTLEVTTSDGNTDDRTITIICRER